MTLEEQNAAGNARTLEERQAVLWATLNWGDESRQHPREGTPEYAEKLARQQAAATPPKRSYVASARAELDMS